MSDNIEGPYKVKTFNHAGEQTDDDPECLVLGPAFESEDPIENGFPFPIEDKEVEQLANAIHNHAYHSRDPEVKEKYNRGFGDGNAQGYATGYKAGKDSRDEEVRELREKLKELCFSFESVLEIHLGVPEKDCHCHTNPPCRNCLDRGEFGEELQSIDDARKYIGE